MRECFRGPLRKLGVVRNLFLENAARRGVGVDDRQWVGLGHDSPVRKAAADAEQHHVARFGTLDLTRALQQEAEIFLFVAVQHPVFRVGARIEGLHEAEIAKDANEDHCAVNADAANVGSVVIGRAQPEPGGGDDGESRVGRRTAEGGAKVICHPSSVLCHPSRQRVDVFFPGAKVAVERTLQIRLVAGELDHPV